MILLAMLLRQSRRRRLPRSAPSVRCGGTLTFIPRQLGGGFINVTHGYFCLITQDVRMLDTVQTAGGMTYERVAITRWFEIEPTPGRHAAGGEEWGYDRRVEGVGATAEFLKERRMRAFACSCVEDGKRERCKG